MLRTVCAENPLTAMHPLPISGFFGLLPLWFSGQHTSRLGVISGSPAPSLDKEKSSRHVQPSK